VTILFGQHKPALLVGWRYMLTLKGEKRVGLFDDHRDRERQIIQLAFLLLVSAYTASRPGALVYVDQNERTNIITGFSPTDMSRLYRATRCSFIYYYIVVRKRTCEKILDNSKIKKFSSLHENWRQWCQLYRKAVGRSLHASQCLFGLVLISGQKIRHVITWSIVF
jgi:hypothetical protein